jgi:serine/threonine protein kinase
MEFSRSFDSSSLLTGLDEATPSTSASQQNDDTDIAADIAQLITAICHLVMQTGGRVSLGTDLFYLNPLTTIGQGASFTVKAVDKERRYQNRFHRESLSNDYFSPDIAFKRLRRFPPASTEERARKLQMVRLEVAALSHPVLLSHENVIKIHGIGWEPCFYGTENPWPVLMVELAPHGTLADFQRTVTNLSILQQADLMMDIALGLEAVHKSEIIHGDIKSENVLVFDHPGRKFIAKIGDFAFSKHESTEQGYLPRGTYPWQAPEVLEGRNLGFNDWEKSDM